MKNWFLLLLLLVGCSNVNTSERPVPIPETLTTTSIYEPDADVKPSREELLQPIFNSIDRLAELQLPFDEPLHEDGQQDGSLRPRWYQAFLRGDRSFYFNNDKYYVYAKGGFPRPPEVCADFLVDTLEYAGNTWYAPIKIPQPYRSIGKLEIRDTMKDVGLEARRVNELVDYFKSQPENYEFIWAVDDPRFAPTNYWGGPKVTPVNGTGGLKEFFYEYKVQLGDMIIISGLAPWDHGAEVHNHSMFVTGLDSAGMVEYITGNDAWVRKKRIDIEMARAPQRKLKYIIRLTDKLLMSLR